MRKIILHCKKKVFEEHLKIFNAISTKMYSSKIYTDTVQVLLWGS